MKKNRWLILFVILFISSVLIFILNDREKAPEIITESNLTSSDSWGNSIGIWNKTDDMTTYTKCPEGYEYQQIKNICYKENPLGHTMMTFPQIIASILTIATIGIYEFKNWRIYLSSKLLPYKNKYVDELQPIPKSPDLFIKHGFLWVRGGYDALVTGSENTLYVAKTELTSKCGNNIILQGALEKVSPQQLFNYIGRDINLIREMLNLPILKVDKKGKLLETQAAPTIFLTLPENYANSLAFTTIKGSFGFGADRVALVLESLYKMRRGLSGFGHKLKKASQSMLTDAKEMSESTAIISDAVGKTQNSNIESTHYRDAGQQDSNNERRNM